MKAVLISTRPKWCERIASGWKTVEVRKTRPNIATPFKCYIYCTMPNTKDPHQLLEIHGSDGKIRKANGKVIGEFVCSHIEPLKPALEPYGIYDIDDDYLMRTCLTHDAFWKYGNGATLYGWHISDLKIYDKPKELSEFWAYNEGLHKRHDTETDFCCYDATDENGEALTDCGEAYNDILNCYRCWEEWSGWCHHVTRPPQSWMYVEENV